MLLLKRTLFRWILITLGIIIFVFYFNPTIKPKKYSKKEWNDSKIIFFTKTWWEDGSFPFIEEANEYCPRCLLTEDQSFFEISDAVVFQGVGDFLQYFPIPKRSSLDQRWVFLMHESPLNSYLPPNYEDVFNWTMTYRRDSDIFFPFGTFMKSSEIPRPEMTEPWAFVRGAGGSQTYKDLDYTITPSLEGFKDRRSAAWIVNRCTPLSAREKITSELSKHISVDIYGACGNHKCQLARGKAKTGVGVECRIEIHKKYKFYLAFENSLCEDYATEKVFDTLLTEMVPVVYGGSDYAALLPPNSFINVRDFPSVKELANHLNYLAENPSEWLKYFEWRKTYWVSTSIFVSGYCRLCDALWNKLPGKSYESVNNWWKYGNSSTFTKKTVMAGLCTDGQIVASLLVNNLNII